MQRNEPPVVPGVHAGAHLQQVLHSLQTAVAWAEKKEGKCTIKVMKASIRKGKGAWDQVGKEEEQTEGGKAQMARGDYFRRERKRCCPQNRITQT